MTRWAQAVLACGLLMGCSSPRSPVQLNTELTYLPWDGRKSTAIEPGMSVDITTVPLRPRSSNIQPPSLSKYSWRIPHPDRITREDWIVLRYMVASARPYGTGAPNFFDGDGAIDQIGKQIPREYFHHQYSKHVFASVIGSLQLETINQATLPPEPTASYIRRKICLGTQEDFQRVGSVAQRLTTKIPTAGGSERSVALLENDDWYYRNNMRGIARPNPWFDPHVGPHGIRSNITVRIPILLEPTSRDIDVSICLSVRGLEKRLGVPVIGVRRLAKYFPDRDAAALDAADRFVISFDPNRILLGPAVLHVPRIDIDEMLLAPGDIVLLDTEPSRPIPSTLD